MTSTAFLPIVLSVSRVAIDVEVRVDTQPTAAGPGNHVARLVFAGCDSDATFREFESAIGLTIQQWPTEDCQVTDDLLLTIDYREDSLGVSCHSVTVTWESYREPDFAIKVGHFLQRLSATEDELDSTRHELSTLRTTLTREVDRGLDRASRKLAFFQRTDLHKAELTQAQAAVYLRIAVLLGHTPRGAA